MLDSQIRITPLSRLTAARLEDLILCREDPCQPVCYSCNQSAMMLIPFNGLLRCENCDRFARLGIRR